MFVKSNNENEVTSKDLNNTTKVFAFNELECSKEILKESKRTHLKSKPRVKIPHPIFQKDNSQ